MTTFTITVTDDGVSNALTQLAQRIANMQPVLQDIGEGIVERAQARFATSTGPDGVKWADNKQSTLDAIAARIRGIAAYGPHRPGEAEKAMKRADARVAKAHASKRPLVGESHSLENQIVAVANQHSVSVTASPVYAAIQQFGGTKAEFPRLWGDIPARPFLPIHPDGSLYPGDQAEVMELINDYLAGR